MVVLAQEEALGLKHNYIGTEHILLGLLREEKGLAACVLASFDVTLERVRDQIVRIVGSGEEATEGQVPFTPRTKKVFELALRESLSLGHIYVGTEHILLGLVREGEGVAARILRDFDADPEKIRNEVIRILPANAPQPSGVTPGSSEASQRIAPGWLDGLGLMLNGWPMRSAASSVASPTPATCCSCSPRRVTLSRRRRLSSLRSTSTSSGARSSTSAAKRRLDEQIEQARLEKERAIESQQFQAAARHRDQERRLTEQQRAQNLVSTETLQAIRHRLGLPTPPDRPTGT